jgi:hypothetical protein
VTGTRVAARSLLCEPYGAAPNGLAAQRPVGATDDVAIPVGEGR